MAASPIIDPARFLNEHLSHASPDLMHQMLHTFNDALMSAEADAVCGAPYGTLSDQRVNSRNGYRQIRTPLLRHPHGHPGRGHPPAALRLLLPRLAPGAPPPRRTGPGIRGATAYLLGVSTRRMERLVESLGITKLRKSHVSVMAKDLDTQVTALRTRPLDAGPYTFVAADALVIKVREEGRVVGVHVMLAVGVNADGHREVLGLRVSSAEDGAGWNAFFADLVARGLAGVRLVTSDAHRGLVEGSYGVDGWH